MQECNVAAGEIETISSQVALSAASGQGAAKQYAAYIGLDVHKETIAVAVAEPGRGEPIYRGEIANTPKQVERLIAKLSEAYDGGLLLFCYEAGRAATGSTAGSSPAATTARWSRPHRYRRKRASASRPTGAMR